MRHIPIVLIALIAAGCGSNSATGPSGALTVVSVTLTAPSFVLLGTPAVTTATALMSDGSMVTSGFTFSVNGSTVLSASTSGVLSGVAAGSTTVTATLQGKSASQAVRVVPDYHGTWAGSYTMNSCSATGTIVCGAAETIGVFFVPGGAAQPMTLTMIQTNATVLAFVNGAQFIVTVSGTIAADGTLSLTGATSSIAGLPDDDQLGIDTWTATLASARIAGPFDLFVSSNEGSIHVPCTITALTRTGS